MKELKTPEPLAIIRTNVQPEEIAKLYLKLEFRKLFANIQDYKFWKQLDNSIDTIKDRVNENDFWQLISGISEGYKLKWVYRVLTDSVYSWSLERIALDDIRMTGMSPVINPILEKAEWKPKKFAQIWKSNPKYATVPKIQLLAEPERDHFPIFLHERDEQLRVFDGMRRVCLAVIEGRDLMEAYVGRIRNSKGQMMVNADKVLFLRVLYDEAPEKDQKLLDAIVTVFKAYIRYYRNGREVVNNVINKWRQDEELAKIAEKILLKK